MPKIKVNLDKRSYHIHLGTDITPKLPAVLSKIVGKNRLFVFYDPQFYTLHGSYLSKELKKNFNVTTLVIGRGERTKSQRELNKIYSFLLENKISKDDFILACGGGVTSDLIGYAAATCLRGVKWGVISTTLLGMVDAGIGGKTGINHKLGKNLIGAFWQPSFVWCDTQYLMTLPHRELLAGIGEIAKYSGLIGQPMLDLFKNYLNTDDFHINKKLLKLMALSAKYKANLIAIDERDNNNRKLLNFGHTFGHAIEQSVGYGKLLHGEAVIIGLFTACQLSLTYNEKSEDNLREYINILEQLITFIPFHKIDTNKLLKAMAIDKKRAGKNLNFILLEKPGKPIITDKVNARLLKKSLTAMLDYYRKYGGQNV